MNEGRYPGEEEGRGGTWDDVAFEYEAEEEENLLKK